MVRLIPLRDENPYHRFPVVTVALIVTNVFVFFSLGASLEAAYTYGAVPCDILGNCPPLPGPLQAILADRPAASTLFTSMFLHADIVHLGFNMLFLWVFGNNVEDRLGHVRFTLFYVVTGLGAAFAHILAFSDSVVPVIGASGAVSGVLGAYMLLWPRATIVSLLPLGIILMPVRTPAWVALGIWFVVQVFGGLVGLGLQEEAGVAFFAHIGGFVAGLALVVPFGGARRRPAETWPR